MPVSTATANFLIILLNSFRDKIIYNDPNITYIYSHSEKMRELRMKYGDDYEQPTAVPMLTGGYNLPAKHVIHVVGLIVQGRLTGEHEKLLAECYRNCLEMAEENHLESIAFCCISTGVFMFPNRRAAEIAVRTVTDWLEETGSQIKVIFNVFKDDDLSLYKYCLGEQEAE